jgi:hypothetical protein
MDARISGLKPPFERRRRGGRCPPILGRGDEPKMPGQGSSPRKFRDSSELFRGLQSQVSSPWCHPPLAVAPLPTYTHTDDKYFKMHGLCGSRWLPTDSPADFPDLVVAVFP